MIKKNYIKESSRQCFVIRMSKFCIPSAWLWPYPLPGQFLSLLSGVHSHSLLAEKLASIRKHSYHTGKKCVSLLYFTIM